MSVLASLAGIDGVEAHPDGILVHPNGMPVSDVVSALVGAGVPAEKVDRVNSFQHTLGGGPVPGLRSYSRGDHPDEGKRHVRDDAGCPVDLPPPAQWAQRFSPCRRPHARHGHRRRLQEARWSRPWSDPSEAGLAREGRRCLGIAAAAPIVGQDDHLRHEAFLKPTKIG